METNILLSATHNENNKDDSLLAQLSAILFSDTNLETIQIEKLHEENRRMREMLHKIVNCVQEKQQKKCIFLSTDKAKETKTTLATTEIPNIKKMIEDFKEISLGQEIKIKKLEAELDKQKLNTVNNSKFEGLKRIVEKLKVSVQVLDPKVKKLQTKLEQLNSRVPRSAEKVRPEEPYKLEDTIMSLETSREIVKEESEKI